MRALRAWLSRFGGLFGRQRRDRELADEMESHLQMHIEDNLARGMTTAEARRQALIKLGGVEQTKESYRERRGLPFLDTLLQDIRFALRMLRKSPGFAAVAVLTLALGIGANTAIFSVVNAVLLKPLSYKDASRLVVVWENNPHHVAIHNVVSPPNFLDWRAENRVFQDMAYLADTRANLTGGDAPEQVDVQNVSANFFDVLGVKLALGHAFTAVNGRQGNDNVIVLSDRLWRDRFASDPAVVGKSIELNGKSNTIVGVAPRGFDLFIAEGSLTGAHPQLWAPFVFPPEFHDRAKVGRFFTVLARLKFGVSLMQAQTQMNVISSGLAEKYPQYDANWGATVTPLREEISGAIRPALLILFGAVGFVLIIACANVSSLQLSRAAGRKREMAVRVALGASRWRIARQLLTESVLLAATGGGLGIFLAIWGTNALLQKSPQNLLNLSSVSADPRVLAFAMGVTLFAACLFGFLPSYSTAYSQIASSLKESGRTASASEHSRTIRSALVISEIALALILLAGSALLVQSFVRLIRVNPGFDAGHLLTFKLSLPASKYKHDAACIAFYGAFLDKLRQIPGVRSVSDENLPPFSGFALMGVATGVVLPGKEALPVSERPTTAVRVVGSEYFRTMGIPLVGGRTFQPAELSTAKHVVIVNETFAKEYFPRTNPIGQKITIDMKDQNVPSEIVGVVGDVHGSDLSAAPWPTTYWPYPELAYSGMTVVVRTRVPPLSIVPAVRDALSSLDKDEPIANVATMDQLISNSVARSRFAMFLLAVLAALSLVLAAIGIYGVMSYAVAQRTNEIGIRMALGAQRGDVLRLVVGQGARLALIGVLIGAVGAFALTQLMRTLLFEVSPSDPWTFADVAILLTIVALAASYIPARRAMEVDPMVALRYE